MKKIKNFAVSLNDLNKIMNRGCRVCKENNFKYIESKHIAICQSNNCGARYYGVDESFLDCLEKTNNTLNIYRSANIDNPGEEYEVRTTKSNYCLRKAITSQR